MVSFEFAGRMCNPSRSVHVYVRSTHVYRQGRVLGPSGLKEGLDRLRVSDKEKESITLEFGSPEDIRYKH